MPMPRSEFEDADIAAARRLGEQHALGAFQADEDLDLDEARAMEMSGDAFPGHTERQRGAFGFEIKDAAERFFAKLKDLAS